MLCFMGPSCISGYILAFCEENGLAKSVAITSVASHYKRAAGNGAVLGWRNFVLLSCHAGGSTAPKLPCWNASETVSYSSVISSPRPFTALLGLLFILHLCHNLSLRSVLEKHKNILLCKCCGYIRAKAAARQLFLLFFFFSFLCMENWLQLSELWKVALRAGGTSGKRIWHVTQSF